MNKINWFPGHMSKTVNKLKELKYIDLIVEIVDARALHISSNPEILKLFPNVLKTTIALKSDLSDVAGFKEGLLCSIHDKNIIKKIIALFDHVLDNKIQSYKRKGLVNPQFYILVVGLPNVGKSTLINKLKGKRTLIAQNRPGVTRTEQLIKINERYLMYDTPGIMVKNIVKITDGYILSLLNVIKNDILPYETILAWAYDFLKKYYYQALYDKFNIEPNLSFMEYIDVLNNKYHFFNQKRSFEFLFKNIVDGQICKLNYEKDA